MFVLAIQHTAINSACLCHAWCINPRTVRSGSHVMGLATTTAALLATITVAMPRTKATRLVYATWWRQSQSLAKCVALPFCNIFIISVFSPTACCLNCSLKQFMARAQGSYSLYKFLALCVTGFCPQSTGVQATLASHSWCNMSLPPAYFHLLFFSRISSSLLVLSTICWAHLILFHWFAGFSLQLAMCI